MSLRYLLFGIPKTYHEFVDKAERKGEQEIDITPRSRITTLPGVIDPYCETHLIFEAGKAKLTLRWDSFVTRRTFSKKRDKLELYNLERTVMASAVEIAEHLEEQGFEVTVFGEHIGKARKELEVFSEQIHNYKKNHFPYANPYKGF